MSITSGFYDALNNDRQYNARQMSEIFDGIIEDGVYQSIGDAFMVKATTGNLVTAGIGRAWFNHTWTLNNAILPIAMDQSEVILDRYDVIVLEVNADPAVRINTVKVIKGTPASVPVKPTMTNSTYVHQYPFAYIYRTAGSVEITQADITNTIGTTECPFVIGVLDMLTIDDFVAQWGAQWNIWFNDTKGQSVDEMEEWLLQFTVWFDNMKDQLSTDAAGNLQLQIDIMNAAIITLSDTINIVTTDIAKIRGVKVTLTTAGWVASSTYAKYSFKQTVLVSAMTALEGVPIECVQLPSSGIKSDAEVVAYGLVKEAYGDSTALAVYFYATALPVTDISYSVKEVIL